MNNLISDLIRHTKIVGEILVHCHSYQEYFCHHFARKMLTRVYMLVVSLQVFTPVGVRMSGTLISLESYDI